MTRHQPIERRRPVATYSIVARDPDTGEMGVAVQSHWFSVGQVVPWAEAGVGAVATQSLADPRYGQHGLDLLRGGTAAPEALEQLLAADDGRAVRQVAMVDANGRTATHTGDRCIEFAGHASADQCSVQANMMRSPDVWPAMLEAFVTGGGDLVERLVAALAAAEVAGGDVRGRQSAAIVVVAAESTGQPWVDRRFDLRVEDHPQPVDELQRLVTLQRAYHHMNAGDAAIERDDWERALAAYRAAEGLAPHIVEMPFWQAVGLVNGGRVDEAIPVFRGVFEREPVWAELVPRLVGSGLLDADADTVARIRGLRSA